MSNNIGQPVRLHGDIARTDTRPNAAIPVCQAKRQASDALAELIAENRRDAIFGVGALTKLRAAFLSLATSFQLIAR